MVYFHQNQVFFSWLVAWATKPKDLRGCRKHSIKLLHNKMDFGFCIFECLYYYPRFEEMFWQTTILECGLKLSECGYHWPDWNYRSVKTEQVHIVFCGIFAVTYFLELKFLNSHKSCKTFPKNLFQQPK